MNWTLFLVLIVLSLISMNFSLDLNSEAWEQYHSAMKRILSETKESGRLSFVVEPYDKMKFISLLESSTFGVKDGVFQIINSNQGMCDRYASKLMTLQSPIPFLNFKKSLDKCFLKQISSRQVRVGGFTIKGSSLVNGNGDSIYQKQSFISSTLGNEVKVNAFNPRGDLENCRPKSMPVTYFNSAIFEAIKRNVHSLFGSNTDDDEHALLARGWQEARIAQVTPCVIEKFRAIMTDSNALSLKEFELKVNINKLEIVQVSNDAINVRIARQVGYGMIPKTLLIAHQPSIVFSLSRDDFGKIVKEFNNHRGLVVGGMKFDRLKILRKNDDQDLRYNGFRVLQEAWTARRTYCVRPCFQTYSLSEDTCIARKEFQLSQCICICAKTLASRTNVRSVDQVKHLCSTSSSKFQIELSSSSSEVIGLLSM